MSAQNKLSIPVPAVWVGLVALCLLAGLWYSQTRQTSELPEPQIVSTSAQGQHLQMPSQASGQWQQELVPAQSGLRQQVLERLSVVSARYQQLRPQIGIWAEPGLPARERVARQLGDALAQYNLGKLVPDATPPAYSADLEGAVIMRCAEKDQRIARELLGALAPYLSGRVFLMFDQSASVNRMQLFLIGKPWFDPRGLATFDPQ